MKRRADKKAMTATTSEVNGPGPRVRPLPPPIPEAPADPLDEAARISEPAPRSDLVIVPAVDTPVDHPLLPDRVSSRQRATAWMRAHGQETDANAIDKDQSSTAWLRSDPPPMLLHTTWLRVVLMLVMFAALGSALRHRYNTSSNDLADAQLVVGLHAGVVGALVVWCFIAMRNANALVPATRYQPRSRGWVASSLWILALVAPVGGIIVSDAARTWFDDSNHPGFVFAQIGIGLVVAILVWLPFRYLAVQSSRVGAPRRAAFEWFWLPTLAVGAGFLIMALGLRSDLNENGLTDGERLIEAAVVYGLPMFLFILTAWQATSAFDSVINIRWRRWKTGWDQSEAAFGASDAS